MTKLKKIFLSSIAILSLVACVETKEKESIYTKEELAHILQLVETEMAKETGFALDVDFGINLEITDAYVPMSETIDLETATELSTNKFSINAESSKIEYLIGETTPSVLEEYDVTMQLQSTFKNSELEIEKEESNKFDGFIGAYLKDDMAYAQLNGKFTKEDFSSDENPIINSFSEHGKMPLEQILEKLESYFGEISVPYALDYNNLPIDITTLLETVIAALPNAKVYTKGNQSRIVYTITMEDILKVIDDLAPIIATQFGITSLDNLAFLIDTIKASVETVFKLNEFNLEVTILDDNLITDVKTDIDFIVNLVSLLDTEVEVESYKFQYNLDANLDTLKDNHVINFPEGMEDWPLFEDKENNY